MAYTTANLLTSIERQSFAPANQNTFATSDILSLADEVLQTTILPAILDVREEYYVTYADQSIVANTATYQIPARAIGMTVREVHLVGSDGAVRNLTRTSMDQLHLRQTTATSTPSAFYLVGDTITLSPTPGSSTGSLRVYYALRPGALVETSAAAVISAINTTTNVVTVSSIPSTWATGTLIDTIAATGSQRYMQTDAGPTISGSDLTFSSLPSGLAVGDYLAVAGQSPLVQLPPDFRAVLASLTAAEMLLGMNQPSGQVLYAKALKILESAQKMLTPRVPGEHELILPDWS